MYTILENARIVLALLKKHNIRHIVLSPGGSNIPIVQGAQEDPFFKCYSVVDERSAMYFAIGLYLQTGEIIATSCTSAQATRNYIPGLTEAFYKHVPILAITMSKHPRYIGQDYMQCPIQTSLPIDAVKKSFSLPCINTEHDRAQCVRTANEAILELTHHGNGPVQLDIEELDSETWHFDDGIKELPDVRTITRYNYWDKLNPEELSRKKILIVMGENIPYNDSEVHKIESFAESHDVFIYVNQTSNYRGKYSRNANLLLHFMTQTGFMETFMPDIVITVGGLTGDYAIYGKLFNAPDQSFVHWRVSIDGNVVDTYGKLTRIYEMRVEDFFDKLSTNVSSFHDYSNVWNLALDKIQYNVDLPLSNAYAALKLSAIIPEGSSITFAIHNSLRVWNWMQIENNVKAYSPVAAFGIDGASSLSFGVSMVTEKLSFLITGDLAYLYDLNALSIRGLRNNIRIVLCNNNGGYEFKSIDRKVDVSKYIAAYDHFKDSKGWAETNGFEYVAIRSKDELDRVIPYFISTSEKPIIVELFTTQELESLAAGILYRENWHGSKDEESKRAFDDNLKGVVKSIVGGKGLSVIKRIIHK